MFDFLPDNDVLAAGLALAFGFMGGRPEFVGRTPNPYGDGRSEIIDWRLPDGREIRAFCKRDDPSDPNSDVAYEARVYHEVLQPLGLSTLKFYGAGVDESSKQAWLLIEHVDGPDDRELGLREEDAMVLAARWLGGFHAACERRFPTAPSFLHRYDGEYYARLARQVLEEACPAERNRLEPLSERLGPFLGPLMATRATIVHTDFYAHNLLIRDGCVRPIDWEMAAVDLGEADLAFLVYGWDDDVAERCEAAYVASRWPAGAPADFGLVLNAARLCLHLYKLSTRDWTGENGYRRHADYLYGYAENLGLLGGAAG
jgi:hypothetical protein